MTAVTDRDLREYYRKKTEIVRSIQKTWKILSEAAPGELMDALPKVDAQLKSLEDIDSRWTSKYGELPQKHEAQPVGPFRKTGREREALKAALLEASDVLEQLKTKVREMKNELGRRISEIRTKDLRPRHGRFDRKG